MKKFILIAFSLCFCSTIFATQKLGDLAAYKFKNESDDVVFCLKNNKKIMPLKRVEVQALGLKPHTPDGKTLNPTEISGLLTQMHTEKQMNVDRQDLVTSCLRKKCELRVARILNEKKLALQPQIMTIAEHDKLKTNGIIEPLTQQVFIKNLK